MLRRLAICIRCLKSLADNSEVLSVTVRIWLKGQSDLRRGSTSLFKFMVDNNVKCDEGTQHTQTSTQTRTCT